MAWEPIVLVASLWVATGMTFAQALYWRGHDGWHWMPICAVAGPLAILLVADQARFVEPQAQPISLGDVEHPGAGVTVVVPAAAVGALGAQGLDRFGLRVGKVAVATPVPYERMGNGSWDAPHLSMQATLAEATQHFAPYPVELVVLPGPVADAIANWAAAHTPAVIVTTRRAYLPRTLGRLVQVAAKHPGVSTFIFDTAPLTASTTAPEAA